MPSSPTPTPSPSESLQATAKLTLIAERNVVVVEATEIVVTPTQFQIVAALAAEPGRAFRRRELVERCIGTKVNERTIDVHVKELRRKLGDHGSRIQTVRRVGYRLSE